MKPFSFLGKLVRVSVAAFLSSGMALVAESIEIVNGDFELPVIDDVVNATFNGAVGGAGKVPGWESNEPGIGGVIHYEEHYPGRGGSNVLYLHGSGEHNFHTEAYDLGVDLQSHATYVLSFDVVRWKPVNQDDLVRFRIGLYTGPDYESRVPLVEYEGDFLLVDRNNYSVDKKRVTLVCTTGEVPPGTKFWIGGDVNGAPEFRRAAFDNFTLDVATLPPTKYP